MANLTGKFISAISEPSGMWEKLIMAFHSGIHNYAWAVIVFTIVLKLILLPLDFLNKYITQKNTKIQAIIQPEVAKIQKQYGNNKQLVNQKTMELYKKNNYNVVGSCVVMIVNLVLTLVIFITLFSGLNSMASYKIAYQYNEIQKSYYSLEDYDVDNIVDVYKGYYVEFANNNLDEQGNFDSALAETYAKEKTKDTLSNKGASEEAVAVKNERALNRYNEVKESWLWVENIWKSDTPWSNSVASFNEYLSGARASFTETTFKLSEEENAKTVTLSADSLKELAEVEYNTIMDPIRDSAGRANGYLIIVILAVGLNLISVLLTQGKLKFKRKKMEDPAQPKQPGGWLMMILIPGLMLYITLTYNTVFALYIFASSLVGILTTPLINYFVKLLENRKSKKQPKETVDYSRKK